MQVSPCSLGHLDGVSWEKISPRTHSLAGWVPFKPQGCKKGVGVAVLRVLEAPKRGSVPATLLRPRTVPSSTNFCSPGDAPRDCLAHVSL